MRVSASWLVVGAFSLGTVACTLPAPQGGAPAQGNPATASSPGNGAAPASGANGSGTGTAQPATGSTCGEILTCAEACSDAACEDACIAKGSDAAKQKIQAVQICLEGNTCANDPGCMEVQCKIQLDQCRNDVAPKYESPLAPGSGSVPPELVGKWVSQMGNDVYNFNADGTYTATESSASGGTCGTATSYNFEGIVLFKQSTVTLSQTSAKRTTAECSSIGTTQTITPTTETKPFYYEAGVLSICDSTSKDTCNVQLKKQ